MPVNLYNSFISSDSKYVFLMVTNSDRMLVWLFLRMHLSHLEIHWSISAVMFGPEESLSPKLMFVQDALRNCVVHEEHLLYSNVARLVGRFSHP